MKKTHYAKIEDGRVAEMANAEILLAEDSESHGKSDKQLFAEGWWPVLQSDKDLDHDPATHEVVEMFDVQDDLRQVVWVRNVVEKKTSNPDVTWEHIQALHDRIDALTELYVNHRDRMDEALLRAETAASLIQGAEELLDVFRSAINSPTFRAAGTGPVRPDAASGAGGGPNR